MARAARKEKDLLKMMLMYRSAVAGYLRYLLLREKDARSDAEATEKAEAIWGKLMGMLPTKLTAQWSVEGRRFRDVLLEGCHEAYHAYFVPDGARLLAPPPAPSELHHRMGLEFVCRAWKALQEHERRAGAATRLYTILKLKEDHPDDSDKSLNARFAALPEAQGLDEATFRKRLSRARNLFYRFLIEAVAGYVAEKDVVPTPAEYRNAFEELGLLKDYERALKSVYCRQLLGLAGGIAEIE
jgi:hypothetical protein